MVNAATGSPALLLVLASTASASWISDPGFGRQRDGLGRRFPDILDQQPEVHGTVQSNRDDASILSGVETDVELEQRAPYPTVLIETIVSLLVVTPESGTRLNPRQTDTDQTPSDSVTPSDAAAPPPPSPPIIPVPTATDSSAAAIIASLSASASLALSSASISAAGALSSVSASFQQEIAALSLKSSSDLASASSAIAAAIATNSGVSSSIAASASSAGAAVASSSAAESASGALASASSAIASASGAVASANSAVASANSAAESANSAAASASNAAASASSSIDALQTSLMRATGAMPSTTSVAPIVQPNTSPASADGTFVVTSSQITAIVVGTFVGSAIVTLVIVCFISSCRKKRAKQYAERHGLLNSPNSQDHDDSTGRAEGYWSRQESGAVPPSAALPRPSASMGQAPVPTPQRPPSAVHRSNLPTLVEESPPVSATINPSYSGGNALNGSAADGLPYSPPVMDGVLQQPKPVKLALTKRLSGGGSLRRAVVRVGSQVSDNERLPSTITTSTAQPNDSYFGSSRASSQALPNRPLLSRSPSSETLPALRKTIASPLTLNPPNAAFAAPEIPAIPPWTGPLQSNTPSNAGANPYQSGSQYENQAIRAPLSQPQRQPQLPGDPFTRAERQLHHIALMVSRKHIEEQQQQASQNVQAGAQLERNLSPSSSIYSGNNVTTRDTNAVAAAVNSSDIYLAAPVPRRVSPLPPVSSRGKWFDGTSQTQTVVVNDPEWTEYPSSLSPPPPPPPRSPLRKSAALSVSDKPPMPPVSPLSPSPVEKSDQNDKEEKFSPMPAWRSSNRNSFYAPGTYNVVGAVGLAQATAGLDIIGGMAGGGESGKGKETVARAKSEDSNGSNSTADSNINANGGRYTWLASAEDITQEAGNTGPATPPKTTTITSAWGGGGPLMEPSPAEFASAASMRRNERQGGGGGVRLTMDGKHFPAPLDLSSSSTRVREAPPVEPQTPRYSLFPRTTDGGGSPGVWSMANSDISRMSATGGMGGSVGVAVSRDPSPVESSSRRASRQDHKRSSSSLSTFNLGRRDKRSSGL